MHTRKRVKHNIRHLVILAILAFALFIIFSPGADAKIVVEGDLEFKDDINDCLNTYRNAEGIVGDVIRELEAAENEHKIINSPDWSNTSNDIEAATGGSGSGTVTRVDKEELEKIVKEIDELKHKDFCTALLHELWHAVDADRGSRTSHSDTVGGVKRNEVEATIFQNFIHAIRGVPPRTAYGGTDISDLVLISGDEAGGATDGSGADMGAATEPAPSSPPSSPTPPPAPAPTAAMSFTHVAPGVYSEVYVTVRTQAGAQVQATLIGPGVSSAATQSGAANTSGVASFTWRIVSYGAYSVSGTAAGQSFSSSVSVQ